MSAALIDESMQGLPLQGGLPLSVISAKVKLALRCRSTLSEYTRVVSALRGSPEKKSVSCRWKERQKCRRNGSARLTFSRYCSRSATASLSLSASTGSYVPSLVRPARRLALVEADLSSNLPLQHDDKLLPMAEVGSPRDQVWGCYGIGCGSILSFKRIE